MADFKPRWIPWDEDAFRADRVVQRMTPRQRSLCRNLIIESYYNSLRPYLPSRDEELWLLADANDLREWLDNREAVVAKFTLVEAVDGSSVFQNKRVSEEWAKMESILAQRKSAAARSVEARRMRVTLPQTPSQEQIQLEVEGQEQVQEERSTVVQRPLDERSTALEPVTPSVEERPETSGTNKVFQITPKGLVHFNYILVESGWLPFDKFLQIGNLIDAGKGWSDMEFRALFHEAQEASRRMVGSVGGSEGMADMVARHKGFPGGPFKEENSRNLFAARAELGIRPEPHREPVGIQRRV